jgi:hypothetical protein
MHSWLSSLLILLSWVIALIEQFLLHNKHELQFWPTPNTEAPGILLTHPDINPTGHIVLQNGLYNTNELAITIATNIHPIK